MKLRPMPYPYRHPGNADDANAPPIEDEPALVQPTLPDGSVGAAVERKPDRLIADLCTLPTTTIRIGIPLPLVRTVALYDRLSDAGLSERAAALKVGHRATDCWRNEPGAELQVPGLGDLAARSLTIETTKAVDRTVFDRIGRQFDPHDVHSGRLLGRLLGHAVLVWWIARDAKT